MRVGYNVGFMMGLLLGHNSIQFKSFIDTQKKSLQTYES